MARRLRLAILADVFPAFIGEIAQCAKPKIHNLIKKGVEFAQGRDVGNNPTEKFNIALKGTLRRNELADAASQMKIVNRPLI
jgi:hypothetical protein